MNVSSVGSTTSAWSAVRDRMNAFRNGTQNISREELEEAANQGGEDTLSSQILSNFDTIDANGDGISYEELSSYAQSSGYTEKSMKGGRRPNGPPPPGGPPKDMTVDDISAMRDSIASSDPEKAGQLDTLVSNFSAADTDGSGSLSPDEFKTYADANGISLPKGKRGHGTCSTGAAVEDTSTTETTTTEESETTDSVAQRFIQAVLSRYQAASEASSTELTSSLTA